MRGAKIIIETDHSALSFLTSCRFLNARLTRWALAVQDYDLYISYVKGSTNVGPDALSRMSLNAEGKTNDELLVAITLLKEPGDELKRQLRNVV